MQIKMKYGLRIKIFTDKNHRPFQKQKSDDVTKHRMNLK